MMEHVQHQYLYKVRGDERFYILTDAKLNFNEVTLDKLDPNSYLLYQVQDDHQLVLVQHLPSEASFPPEITNAPRKSTVDLPEDSPPPPFQVPQPPAHVNVPTYPPTNFVGALGFGPGTAPTPTPTPTSATSHATTRGPINSESDSTQSHSIPNQIPVNLQPIQPTQSSSSGSLRRLLKVNAPWVLGRRSRINKDHQS